VSNLKVLIIYFSQTGNTKKIAETIRKGILKSNNTCEITQIKKVDVNILENYDLIGIGTPTFFYREPRNVNNFIQDLKETKRKHCFIFCTHGSLIGNTFYYMNEELTKKGYIVIGTFDSYGYSSLQFYPEPMHTEGHPDEIEFKEAEGFGENICDISKKVQNGDISLIPKFDLISNTWWNKQSEQLSPEFLRKVSPKFVINEDVCTKCLACEENCPVDAIDIEANPPEIQKEECISCYYCEQACPVGAIKTDWTQFAKISRGNLPRYIEELEKAEKQGKFRPYVDYRNIK
jgi:flavodoxin/Fe-S-cluster-containing hydrogenase component 2